MTDKKTKKDECECEDEPKETPEEKAKREKNEAFKKAERRWLTIGVVSLIIGVVLMLGLGKWAGIIVVCLVLVALVYYITKSNFKKTSLIVIGTLVSVFVVYLVNTFVSWIGNIVYQDQTVVSPVLVFIFSIVITGLLFYVFKTDKPYYWYAVVFWFASMFYGFVTHFELTIVSIITSLVMCVLMMSIYKLVRKQRLGEGRGLEIVEKGKGRLVLIRFLWAIDYAFLPFAILAWHGWGWWHLFTIMGNYYAATIIIYLIWRRFVFTDETLSPIEHPPVAKDKPMPIILDRNAMLRIKHSREILNNKK